MKQLIMLIGIIIFLIISSCNYDYNIWIDDSEFELSTEGIDAWGYNIKYMDKWYSTFRSVDCIIKTHDGKITTPDGKQHWGVAWWNGNGERPRPLLITIGTNNDVVIAHEFGHFLGYKHTTNWQSIMYSEMAGPESWYMSRPLEWFDEFK